LLTVNDVSVKVIASARVAATFSPSSPDALWPPHLYRRTKSNRVSKLTGNRIVDTHNEHKSGLLSTLKTHSPCSHDIL
jgi:hypothetical protein